VLLIQKQLFALGQSWSGLDIKHLRVVTGNSMGGMQTWIWGSKYTQQPASAQFASAFYATAANGGSLAYYKAAPTREKADQ
jgi:homoserine O-acetyltransferase